MLRVNQTSDSKRHVYIYLIRKFILISNRTVIKVRFILYPTVSEQHNVIHQSKINNLLLFLFIYKYIFYQLDKMSYGSYFSAFTFL